MSSQSQPLSQSGAAAVQPSSTFLSRLPRDSQQRLLAQSTRIILNQEHRLCEAGSPLTWAYLPCAGVVSLQTMTEDGETVEVAMVGREGVVGVPVLEASDIATHSAVVAVRGEALRLNAEALQKELGRDVALQRALIQYWHSLMTDMATRSACHRFHSARQRLARWLLAASDRAQSPQIHMTQERLAQALGLQRTGVTVASVALQDAGAIKSRHGRITIVDRQRLETLACECYRVGRRGPSMPGK
jgi:CRP-like cAMP-binding protein